ncbi:hypothetical protein BCR24_10715 [Enterococcus ureilyticus]|uniref:Uncharacterized protein n=1 Tax=Enterococcus ureilyticus TaxID=1131292 RepID=A0A1E5HEX2_9ENTE|nr:hypothetical protein [Enterococcus ureilyticus]MBM7689223.1 hypothetical protein [Enterococcus ureilyticus]MBO0445603.1 hypothetical protein [Enterococcus ureilyticus]OEG23502.1 hypothetical protein BCR24_10715 [Enterococcus ureilyticus]
MGEARNRKITELYTKNFYGNFVINLILKGKPIIQILPDGVVSNFSRKTIFVPWSEILTIFDENVSIPGSLSSQYIIGITVSNKYAKLNYKNALPIKKIIRQSKPFRFSDGISGTKGNIKLNHDFSNEKVVLYINRKQLRNKGKDLFSILKSNLEVIKTGYTYK